MVILRNADTLEALAIRAVCNSCLRTTEIDASATKGQVFFSEVARLQYRVAIHEPIAIEIGRGFMEYPIGEELIISETSA